MRIAVTGRHGQLVRSLIERAKTADIDIQTVARPEADLARPETVESALLALRPDAVVNAAAFTAVDRAESEAATAYQVNERGAAAAARAAARLGIPVVQISTDYVFDGTLDRPYREDDPVKPLGVYGDSKLRGERAVAAASDNHAILRTSWLYSPFGSNFVLTMLSLAARQRQVSVVGDQRGAPASALDVADGVIAVVANLLKHPSASDLRGVFHMTSGGDTNWAEFARAIFAASSAAGGPSADVLPITTAGYPTAARRPANSRLDNQRLFERHGVRLPQWEQPLAECVRRIVNGDGKT